MTQPVIIPRWLYERFVAKDGKEATDATMAAYGAVAVADWNELPNLEQVKERVNRG